MNKITAALLALALLFSLAGCGGNSAGNDVPSGNIESTQAPSETPETAPGTIESTDPAPESEGPEASQDPAQSEEPSEAVQDPAQSEGPAESETPTAQPTKQPDQPAPSSAPVSTSAPTSPPAPTPAPAPTAAPTPTPAATAAPTSTPAPAHTHTYTVTTNATCTSKGVETCSCGKTRSIPATEHAYLTQTIPETGHVEQVAVTKTVDDYEVREVTTWGCRACSFTTTDHDELLMHTSDYENNTSPHLGAGCWWITTKQNVKVGSHEETTYENRWIVDTPASTVFTCVHCGHQIT